MSSRVLVTGASGQVGGDLYRRLKGRNVSVLGTCGTRRPDPELRLLNPLSDVSGFAMVKEFSPRTIIHCGALTAVDYCEANPEEAERVNVWFTRQLIQAMPSEALFVFISTEYIFDGESGPYDEESRPNPLNVYGRTKLVAEEAIKKLCPENHLIIRTTVVFGEDVYRKNFVLRLVDNLGAGKPVCVPADQVSTPTYIPFLNETILQLILTGKRGVWNVVCGDRMSRYELGLMTAKIFGLDESLVEPVSTPELDLPARRPLEAGLRTGKIRGMLGITPPTIEECLRDLRVRTGRDG